MKSDTHFDLATACPSLQLGEDGIFYSSAGEAISYPEEGNEACFQIEDQSFWFRHRNDCICELVRNFPPRGSGPIIDVGGGNGFVARGLMDAGWDVVLVEPGPSGARNAKKRGLEHVICGTTHSAGFKNGSLPAIGVFDVVGNGIEDRTDGVGERFRSRHEIRGPMILYIGRRDADKGYGHVTQAFPLVKQKQPDATLVCMGPPGGVKKVEEPGILNFEFVDEQNKHDALAACDCLCVPSEGESFGLVYMEAGRYAKPVIARKLSVLEELLEGGKAGLLVGRANPAKNENRLEPEELSEQILNLIQSPRLAAQIGEECRRVSCKFVWSEVVKKFEASYERVVVKV